MKDRQIELVQRTLENLRSDVRYLFRGFNEKEYLIAYQSLHSIIFTCQSVMEEVKEAARIESASLSIPFDDLDRTYQQ